MADLVFIVITLVFFAVCVAYVRGLDRIVRSGEEAETPADEVAS
jgi:hypothetical protein